MSKGRTVVTGAGIGVGTLLAIPAAAHADTIPVTNLNGDGPGSLRQALEDANSSSDADRIVFKSTLSGTLNLTGPGGLEIESDTEIVGPGARKVAITKVDGGSIFVPRADSDPSDVSISGLSLRDNRSRYNGGAIAAYADESLDLTLSRMTISNNVADGSIEGGGNGGGVAMITNPGGSGTLVIENSTISGNRAVGGNGEYGGGVYTYDSDLTVTNSTISGNTAGEDGGGVYATRDAESPEAQIRNSTISSNTAATDSGGGIWAYGVDVTLRGSIVANNVADSVGQDLFDDSTATFAAAFSLIEDSDTDGDPIDNQGGNIFGRNPKLKPLSNNGGPTDTHAFKKSPAKNKLPKGETPKSDQRGAKRRGKGDIGAYELVKCEGVIVNRVGTAKKDKLNGTKRKDGILGLGGNDKLAGKKGKDGLCGGKGKDKLKGGPGKDRLDGGPGKDKEIQ